MRVGQTSPRADLKPSDDEDNGDEQESSDLEPDVDSNRSIASSAIKSHGKNGRRDDEEECDGCYDTVRFDQRLIAVESIKAISHAWRILAGVPFFISRLRLTIIPHGIEVQSDQVW